MPKFELDKAYDPKKYEASIYQSWEDSGAFKPDMNAPKDPFSIILPPPNANGHIHVGTAMYVIEDIMIRYRRMQGHKTLWLPGTDHAGIETQVVYERLLQKDGKSRFDFTREQFYTDVMAFTRGNMSTILGELKSMGFSLDWSRLKFTLDSDIVEIVYETFKQLHDAGYVYRGNRIVNWCTFCRSGFADIEVKYREQVDPLYYIKYGPFVLATVRPETKFGDTAIAVNPKDERYTKYIGQTIEAEDLNGPIKLQVIADDFVNPEFGTGVVKVTPAHDPNDWEMGQRHHLEVKQAIGTDGLLTELTGRYAGMPVGEARAQVAHDLEERGLIDHIDANYTHSVGYHDRCGTLIEPLVVEQWWLKVDELKKPAIDAIKSGDIKFVPERFTKVATGWLDNLHDWNISRQNWWGIRVPVYYNSSSDKSKPEYIVTSNEADAIKTYGPGNYEAETDNFDTWFSSGQWPFATLMATNDFDRGFYPTSVMETGRDIIFLWVTRMIIFGLFRTGKVPFRTVYLHGLVNDEHGKKMSKSKGNVINPLVMTDKYGTDALRLALTIGITPGNDGALSERKIEGYRNFCNKLWNVARFILGQLPADYSPTQPELTSPADHWLKSKLDAAITEATKAIEDYRFSEAGQLIYSLLWDDFADWYLEASKIAPNHNLLVYGLEVILQLLHPVAPFVTEAIWSEMPWHASKQLITSDWPVADTTRTKTRLSEVKLFNSIQSIIQAARTMAAEEHLSKPVIATTSKQLANSRGLIKRLARAADVKLVKEGSGLYLGTQSPAWIEANKQQIEARKHRLQLQLAEKQSYLKSLDAKLANTNYVNSAPEKVVQESRDRRAEIQLLTDQLNAQLGHLA
ncbi:MAG TPA: valine--tRNA ligase [Candidatus Saccharimonadia bacterium]|nr:valine--tRNA ligase [Candidatus Saccharimonadia bacterium]